MKKKLSALFLSTCLLGLTGTSSTHYAFAEEESTSQESETQEPAVEPKREPSNPFCVHFGGLSSGLVGMDALCPSTDHSFLVRAIAGSSNWSIWTRILGHPLMSITQAEALFGPFWSERDFWNRTCDPDDNLSIAVYRFPHVFSSWKSNNPEKQCSLGRVTSWGERWEVFKDVFVTSSGPESTQE